MPENVDWTSGFGWGAKHLEALRINTVPEVHKWEDLAAELPLDEDDEIAPCLEKVEACLADQGADFDDLIREYLQPRETPDSHRPQTRSDAHRTPPGSSPIGSTRPPENNPAAGEPKQRDLRSLARQSPETSLVGQSERTPSEQSSQRILSSPPALGQRSSPAGQSEGGDSDEGQKLPSLPSLESSHPSDETYAPLSSSPNVYLPGGDEGGLSRKEGAVNAIVLRLIQLLRASHATTGGLRFRQETEESLTVLVEGTTVKTYPDGSIYALKNDGRSVGILDYEGKRQAGKDLLGQRVCHMLGRCSDWLAHDILERHYKPFVLSANGMNLYVSTSHWSQERIKTSKVDVPPLGEKEERTIKEYGPISIASSEGKVAAATMIYRLMLVRARHLTALQDRNPTTAKKDAAVEQAEVRAINATTAAAARRRAGKISALKTAAKWEETVNGKTTS